MEQKSLYIPIAGTGTGYLLLCFQALYIVILVPFHILVPYLLLRTLP